MRLGADGVLKCSGQRASDIAHQQLALIGINWLARHDQGIARFLLERRHADRRLRSTSGGDRAIVGRVAFLARGLLASDLMRQLRAALLLESMRRSRHKSAAQTTPHLLKPP
ncbi:hypothetical protein E0H35_03780 [Rhizobium leguminosarum bv. viciae]|uniref:hypothetical protein n=1 Tax=Rhizobium leguminosarum TaxID=384 RepID=UPI0010388742|nr:hypothetical protein [Rhizobium leguminosarum]MBY5340554.1 hypothetical protein [Rhizobium leguminosarum]NKK49458.1 hypothetical protein [Rhizobium leguminosarum bv. viciae]TBZ04237.1 hypothetical protein E0H35_03780 [Rhizobium leguminosarum bv. viciae]